MDILCVYVRYCQLSISLLFCLNMVCNILHAISRWLGLRQGKTRKALVRFVNPVPEGQAYSQVTRNNIIKHKIMMLHSKKDTKK